MTTRTTASNSKPFIQAYLGWLLSALIVLPISIYYSIHWQNLHSFVVSIDQCDQVFCDLFRHFYPMGRELFKTYQPVDGFYYSPFAALLFYWTAYLSTRSALIVWGCVQLIAAGVLYLIPMIDLAKRAWGYQALFTGLFFTSLPLLHNLKWGQVSVILAALILLALYLYEKGQWFLSAILLAVAISIKYYPAIFLVYFLFRRDFRYLLTCLIACGVFLLAIPVLFLGFSHTQEFYRLSSEAAVVASRRWMERDLNSQYIVNVIGRIFYANQPVMPELGLRLIGVLLSAANVLILWFVIAVGRADRRYWAWTLLFTTLPFWMVTSWPHYFVYLPLAQLFALMVILRNQSAQWVKILQGLAWGASVVFSHVILFNLIGRWQFYSNKGFLFLANLLLVLVESIRKLNNFISELRP